MLQKGVTIMPLLEKNFQIKKLLTAHVKYVIEKMQLRNKQPMNKKQKVGIQKLVCRLKDLVFLSMNEPLTEEQKEKQKFLFLYLKLIQNFEYYQILKYTKDIIPIDKLKIRWSERFYLIKNNIKELLLKYTIL